MQRQPAPDHRFAAASDEQLVERTLAGDSGAFDQIVARYKDRVFSYACRMLGDPETADETAQDIFMRAYRYLDHFRGDSKFSTWFYTIVSTTCKNAAKYHGLRARNREDRAADSEDGRRPDPIDCVPSDAFAPEPLLERGELRGAVRDAIQTIPEIYRQVIVLKDVNDFSYEEIARILECELGTVKSRLARARQMMRERLTAAGVLGPECD